MAVALARSLERERDLFQVRLARMLTLADTRAANRPILRNRHAPLAVYPLALGLARAR